MRKKLIPIFMMMAPLAWGQGNCYPISIENNQIKLVSVIAGEEVDTVLTFGAFPAIIPKSIAEKLDQEILIDTKTTVGTLIGENWDNRHYIENLDVNFLGVNTTFNEATVVERSDESGFISVSLLLFRDVLLQLDFPGRKLCMSDPASINLRSLANVELKNAGNGYPAVQATINGSEDAWLILSPDYYGGLMLDNGFAEDLNLEPPAEIGDEQPLYEASLDSLQLGPYTLGNIPAQIPVPGQEHMIRAEGYSSNFSASRVRTVDSEGRIGLDILKHFVLTIDLANTRMHIYAP